MPKILIVDDDPGVRDFLYSALETNSEYQLYLANSGEEALQRLAQTQFDLTLLDLHMTGKLDGMDVFQIIHRECPETAVIIFTAHATLDTALEAMRLSVDNYLRKPISLQELHNAVQQALEKRQQRLRQQSILSHLAQIQSILQPQETVPTHSAAGTARLIRYGNWTMDVNTREICVSNTPLELSPTEFAYLAELLRFAPQVLSAQQLVNAAQAYAVENWQAQEMARYHIYRIRKKLQSFKTTATIETVRGIGYRIK